MGREKRPTSAEIRLSEEVSTNKGFMIKFEMCMQRSGVNQLSKSLTPKSYAIVELTTAGSGLRLEV